MRLGTVNRRQVGKDDDSSRESVTSLGRIHQSQANTPTDFELGQDIRSKQPTVSDGGNFNTWQCSEAGGRTS